MSIVDLRRAVALLVVLLLPLGCKPKGPEVTPVTGVVTLDGKPLELIHVEFQPEVGGRSYAKTDENGRFSLKTDDLTKDGCLPGLAKVSLRDTAHMQDDYISEGGDWVDMSDGRKSRIHTKYYDAMRSPLSYNVEAGRTNHFEIEVEAYDPSPTEAPPTQ